MPIDQLPLTPDLVKKLKAAGVDKATRGQPHSSDHAPAWIELGVKKAAKRAGASQPRKRV